MSELPLPPVALRVLLDVRHPLAYLALHPALAFAREQGIPVDWLPLSVPTLKPPGAAAPDADRGTRHRRYRALAIAREIETYAGVQGLVIREPHREGPAEAAHLGWLWVRQQRREALLDFLVRLFADYWSLELDANDPREVAERVDLVGADGAGFLGWCVSEGPAFAEAVAATLRQQGWFQVPAFVVEDEVFYGRQHLPMIRWILEGRRGPVPI